MKLTPQIPEILDGNVIDGKALAAYVRARAREEVDGLAARGVTLRLAVVLVGDDAASAVYVRNKVRACEEVGIASESIHLPRNVTQETLLALVRRLNRDEGVDGILVQLPLPDHISVDAVIDTVDPSKDVDGFHPANLGSLMGRGTPLQPCTPAGVMTMLSSIGVPLAGLDAVVVGRSVIVGRPMSQMLLRAHATVTTCHRYTRDLESHVRRADLLVVATGVPGLVPGEWVKPGAVVIDVGINRGPDGRLIGDVGFEAARERASAITPVPGGVGPMTIAMLMWNTVLAARLRRESGTGNCASPL